MKTVADIDEVFFSVRKKSLGPIVVYARTERLRVAIDELEKPVDIANRNYRYRLSVQGTTDNEKAVLDELDKVVQRSGFKWQRYSGGSAAFAEAEQEVEVNDDSGRFAKAAR